MFAEQSTRGGAFEWDARTIRALRSYLGWSQSALARDLGIRQQTVSEWETGMYRPRGASVTILSLLARTAGFDASIAGQIAKEAGGVDRPSAQRPVLPRTGLLATVQPQAAPGMLQRMPSSPANRAAPSGPTFLSERGGGGQATEDIRHPSLGNIRPYSSGEEVPM